MAALCLASALAALAMPASADAIARRGHHPHAAHESHVAELESIGSFTPAAADPRAAALLARSGLATGFRFTPAANPGGRRAVTVAVRASRSSPQRVSTAASPRSEAPVAAETATPLTPAVYNLGAAIGWKRFAISGDVTRIDTGPLPGSRDLVDVGVSYGTGRFSTRVQLAADRSGAQPVQLGRDESYSVDLGGTYAITRRFDVTGGLRYKSQRDWLQQLDDQRRDSQTVYFGTAFRF